MASNHKNSKKNQDGLALLVLVIIIFLAISTYYFSSVSVVEIKVDKIERTQFELKRAKQALLDYAAVKWRKEGGNGEIGKLPCPDYMVTGNPNEEEGEQDGSCGTAYANAIGYFPWRTLGIDVTKDSSGSCLLYAVSPAYKTSPAAALTPDSFGQFRVVNDTGAIVQGILPEDRPVVIIIAPESTLPGQARINDPDITCGSYYGNNMNQLLAAYLDNDGITDNSAIDPVTNNVIENLVAKYAGSEIANNPLNDRLITITHEELWQAIENSVPEAEFEDKMKKLTEALALCLAGYANYNDINFSKKSLPWPAAMNLNGNEYRNSFSYDDNLDQNGGYTGRLPFQVDNSNLKIGNDLDDLPQPSNAGLIQYSFCSSITLADATVINLKTGEYFNLWSNWKEHFFYALSKSYAPDENGADCSQGCIKNNGNNKAAMVFFAGWARKGGAFFMRRYSNPFDQALANKTVDPLNEDDKDDIVNYLEGGNVNNFPVSTGSPVSFVFPADDGEGLFDPVPPPPPPPPPPLLLPLSNDIVFCIEPDMTVTSC